MCWQVFGVMESLRSFAANVKKASTQCVGDALQTSEENFSSPLPFCLPFEVVEVL